MSEVSTCYLPRHDRFGADHHDRSNTIAHHIARAVDILILADIDTGFAVPIIGCHAMREFEATGLAGVHIEDQITEETSAIIAGKVLVSTEEM